MRRRVTKDQSLVFLCVALSMLNFFLDTIMPQSILALAGYPAILLFLLYLHPSKRYYMQIFATFLSVLAVTGSLLALSAGWSWDIVANHALSLGFIWVIAALGSRYKQRQEREAYLAALVDSAPDAIWISSPKGKITYWNKGAETLYGYTSKEAIGNPVILIIPENQRKEFRALIGRVKNGAGMPDFQGSRVTKDQRHIDVSVNVTPVTSEEGELIGISFLERNITMFKQQHNSLKVAKRKIEEFAHLKEEELEEAKNKLHDAQRLSDIGTLAATVAHELRNPLGVIRTAAFNIKRKRENEQIDKHVANIEKKVLESEQIINNLLNYARIKMPRYQDVSLSAVIDESVQFAKKRFYGMDIEVKTNLEELNGLKIEADPVQIKEIFDNLLNNAYQAIKREQGTITVRVQNQGKESVSITIKDEGEGIDEQDLKDIFKPFFTTRSKGTGLGLAICNELISLHNGSIEIESEKGQGTQVKVHLPFRQEG